MADIESRLQVAFDKALDPDFPINLAVLGRCALEVVQVIADKGPAIREAMLESESDRDHTHWINYIDAVHPPE